MADKTDAKPDVQLESSTASEPTGQTESQVEVTQKHTQDSPDGPFVSGVKSQLRKYKMNHPERGIAMIINNRQFDYETGQSERVGTDVDADNLMQVFLMLGFTVKRYDNMTTAEMTLRTGMIAREDHSNYDCFVMAILSHGEEGYIYGKNQKVKLDQLVNKFKGDKCPSLAGKPKIFFIQACRGTQYDRGAEILDETDAMPGDEIQIRKIPTEADVLIAYSVVPGYFSWRNSVDGSWFVQALVRVLREHGLTMEIMEMMTLVNQIVAYEFESCTDFEFTDHMKQIPCIVSMLTKQVFFHHKE